MNEPANRSEPTPSSVSDYASRYSRQLQRNLFGVTALLYWFERDPRRQDLRAHSASGFFFRIDHHLLLLVSGHVLDALDSRMRQGAEIPSARIACGFSLDEHASAVDFDLASRFRFGMLHEDGADYGAILLAEPESAFVTENAFVLDVQACPRELDDFDFARYDFVALTGFPSILRKMDLADDGEGSSLKVNFSPALLISMPVHAGPLARPCPRFVGQLLPADHRHPQTGERFSDLDVDGFSGGPMFGLKVHPDGDHHTLEFTLIGMQSAWLREHRYLIAPAIQVWINALADVLTSGLLDEIHMHDPSVRMITIRSPFAE